MSSQSQLNAAVSRQSVARAESQPSPPSSSQGAGSNAAAKPTATEQLDDIVSRLNTQSLNGNRTLRFSVHENLGRSVISVVDKETDEVIRQIPAETALAIAEALSSGNLVSESA
ncbi:MAG: flagellar protein FlaG [Pseudomonadota bacterium]